MNKVFLKQCTVIEKAGKLSLLSRAHIKERASPFEVTIKHYNVRVGIKTEYELKHFRLLSL